MAALRQARPKHHTCFVKRTPLFPLALGTVAGEKRNEHAQTRSFITPFSTKNFGILRGAYRTDILEAGAGECPPLISLIIYRKRPPILNGHFDWTAIYG